MYWVHWSPFKRLVDYPTTYNIIFLFHAYPADGEPAGGSTGAVVLRKPSGSPGTNLNADIATCRARGQKILVSIGGANAQVYLNTKARADAFIESIKTMNVGLGGSGTTNAFDGLDWNNFEGVQQGSQGAWMSYVGQQLRAYYGDDFIFTSPPAASFFQSQNTSDRLLLAELYQNGVIDWLCPQFYDDSSLTTESNISTNLDFYNTSITVNGQSVQIPRDYIGIGFALGAAGNENRWTSSEATTAYSNQVTAGRTPKGAFNWANYEDTGDTFATTVATVITNNGEPPVDTPAFELVASSNFTDGSNTTAQLTAPSGKTTSDFQAGEMCETSNPAPAINLASGKYTEIEWSIQATSEAEDAAQYEFRVTYNGTSLDTYSVTPRWTVGTPAAPPDTTAPSVPTNLNATAVSHVQIDLTWTASTDNIGVAGYNIYRDSVFLASTTGTSYVDTGLSPSTLYSYTVSAFDSATNQSAQSSADTATTSAAPGGGDTTPPVVTITTPTLGEFVSGASVTLSATATDNVAVTSVKFYLNGVLFGEDTTGTSDVFSVNLDSTTKNNGVYTYDVVAVDAAGNADNANGIFVIDNEAAPPIVPDGPKTMTGVVSFTGVISITL